MSKPTKKISLSRREFLKLGKTAVIGSAIVTVGGYSYASALEPTRIEITNVSLTLPRLPTAFNGYRILQLSDIHMDDWMTLDRLQNITSLVNKQAPDTIVITGDFVTNPPRDIGEDLSSGLSLLRAKDEIIGVLGNHDHWTDAVAVRSILENSGVTELNNDVISIKRNNAKLYIGGIDDYYENHDRLPKVINKLPQEGCAILLAHEPDFADFSAAAGNFDLQLSGHSHGGQVILAFIGPIKLPKHAHKYPVGLYQIKNMLLYTNRGIGMVKPRVRFNCRPEITIFTLLSPIKQ